MKVKWHGNGYTNHRTGKVTFNTNSSNIMCQVDGHKWMPYKTDSSQEFCVRCCTFRKKEAEKEL